jgi:hypothetical protein
MEIKTVADLIPYRPSLQELWLKEEFQPVLILLARLRQEAISKIENMPPNLEASTAKAGASIISTELRFTGLLLNLPTRLKELEEQIKQKEQSVLKMKHSQEGGNV